MNIILKTRAGTNFLSLSSTEQLLQASVINLDDRLQLFDR
jgi:hypothetical protein